MDRSKSSVQEIKHSDPKGSVLGYILFSVYVNDLPLHSQELCEFSCDYTTIRTSYHSLSTVFKSLQNCIDKQTWSPCSHMSHNPHKAKFMIITTRHKRRDETQRLNRQLSLPLKENLIEQVESHRVLGVMTDNCLQQYMAQPHQSFEQNLFPQQCICRADSNISSIYMQEGNSCKHIFFPVSVIVQHV